MTKLSPFLHSVAMTACTHCTGSIASQYHIDTHSSGYLGMAVEHCIRAYLCPHCILAQKQYCQKLMAQMNSTAFFTLVCVFLSYKTIHEKFCDCL